MANAVSNLIIKLQDQLSGPAAKAAGSLDKLEAAGKDLKKIGGSTAQIEKLTTDLARLQAQAGKIGEFRDASRALDQASLGYRKAQQDVRKLAAEIAAADKPTRQMKTSLERAKREAASAAATFKQQGQAVRSMRSALEGAGIPVKGLASAEQRLKSQIDSATQSIDRQKKALAGLAKQHTAAAPKVGAGGHGFPLHGAPPAGSTIGSGTAAGLGAMAGRFGVPALGGGVAAYYAVDRTMAATKSALAFEEAMYEVQKATDTSNEGLRQYEKAVLDLARSTGKTKEELAGMLASAGFAGRPKEDLIAFTSYAAKAMTAWGTNAEETGQAMAVIGNVFEANQKRIEEIGDALNTAADISATREKDLLEFLRRAGATGQEAKLSAEQVLAFGAAMGEAGTTMDVAATGFEALMNVMKLGEEFSKDAAAGLRALGVSSNKMRKSFVTKPLETTISLLERIDKVADPLKKAEILTNIFGKEYQDDIQRLMNSLPRLNTLLTTMGNKANYVGSVNKSFEILSEKDYNRLQRANQALDVMAVKLGTPLKIAAGSAAEEVNKLVQSIENGDTLLQRILRRVDAYNTEKNGTKPDEPKALDFIPKWIEENVVPYLPVVAGYNALDQWAGGTGDEAEQKGRESARREKAAEEDRMFARAADLRNRIAKAEAPGARIPPDMIESLKQELEVITRKAGEIAVRRHVDSLRINQTGGSTAPALAGGASFGFGVGGVPEGTENRWGGDPTAPVPPVRPNVDTTAIEAAKGKAAEAEQAIQGLNVTVAPSVDLASLRETDALLGSILGKLGQIGPASQRARTSVAQINTASAAPAPLQPGGELQRAKNGLYANT